MKNAAETPNRYPCNNSVFKKINPIPIPIKIDNAVPKFLYAASVVENPDFFNTINSEISCGTSWIAIDRAVDNPVMVLVPKEATNNSPSAIL